jgi:MYXO-CTERM domain-containing protein
VQPAHPIEDSSDLMFPTKVDSPEQSAAKVTELTAKVTQLTDDLNALKSRVISVEGQSSKGAPGVDGGLLALGLLVVLGLAARRRAA